MTRFILTLEPTGNDTRPPTTRLRGLLKIALRGFGLRCVQATEGEKVNSERDQDQSGEDQAARASSGHSSSKPET